MGNFSMPQGLLGTTIQTIPIQSNRCLGPLGNKKVMCLWLAYIGKFILVRSSRSTLMPIRTTAGTQLTEAIAAEKLDENGLSCRCFILPHDVKVSAKRK